MSRFSSIVSTCILGILVAPNLAQSQGFDLGFFTPKELAKMGLVLHSDFELVKRCNSSAIGDSGESICVRDSIVALSNTDRQELFETISRERPEDGPPTVNELIAGELGSRRPCDHVDDAGYLLNPTFWVIRCDDGRRIALQLSGDVIASGFECGYLERKFNQSCDQATWVLSDPDSRSEASTPSEEVESQ